MTRITALEVPVEDGAVVSDIGRAFRSFEQKGMYELLGRARSEEPIFFAPDRYWPVKDAGSAATSA